MAMINMKVSESDVEDYKPNPYGYGLCISLTEDQVEALGLDKNPPPAGSTVGLRAIATVRRMSQESDPAEEAAEGEATGDIDVTLELQITDLEVTQSGAMSNAGTVLYGG